MDLSILPFFYFFSGWLFIHCPLLLINFRFRCATTTCSKMNSSYHSLKSVSSIPHFAYPPVGLPSITRVNTFSSSRLLLVKCTKRHHPPLFIFWRKGQQRGYCSYVASTCSNLFHLGQGAEKWLLRNLRKKIRSHLVYHQLACG